MNIQINDLSVTLPSGEILQAPAQLTYADNEFVLTLHFDESNLTSWKIEDLVLLLVIHCNGEIPKIVRDKKQTKVPDLPSELTGGSKYVFTKEDSFSVSGQLRHYKIYSDGVFPSKAVTTTNDFKSNTATAKLRISLSHISLSPQSPRSVPESEQKGDFESLIVFHGPRLVMSDILETFLPDNFDPQIKSTKQRLGRHNFKDAHYEGEILDKGSELHLRVKSLQPQTRADFETLIEHIKTAVGFTHGFAPIPIYQDLQYGGQLLNCRLGAQQNLKQSHWFGAVSEQVWYNVSSPNLHNITPAMVKGFVQIAADSKEKEEELQQLLHEQRSLDLADIPISGKLRSLCSGIERLLRLISNNHLRTRDIKAVHIWREAVDELKRLGCLVDDRWHEVFQFWISHRQPVAHGWSRPPGQALNYPYLREYIYLAYIFMKLVATWCGYTGLLADEREETKCFCGSIPNTPRPTKIKNTSGEDKGTDAGKS